MQFVAKLDWYDAVVLASRWFCQVACLRGRREIVLSNAKRASIRRC